MSKLSEKLDRYMGDRVATYPRATGGYEVDEENKSLETKVKESISRKMGVFRAVNGGNSGEIKRTGAKYYGQGITEILAAERKASNLLTVANDDLGKYIEDAIQAAYKTRYRGTAITDEAKEELATKYVYDYVIGGYGSTDAEKEAHKKYKELLAEVARCNTEYNAVLLAKQNFLDENADLIAEAQKAKRLRDLQKSGLLDELGLIEKAEKKEAGESEAAEE